MYDSNNGNSNVNEHYQPPTYNAPQYPYPPVPQQQWQPMPQYYEPPKPPHSGFAITSFVLGLASIVLFALVVPSILAIVFGILGIKDTRSKHTRGKWMAITGLSVAGVLLCFSAIAWTGYLLGVPGYEYYVTF
jgi:hypothetical protein